MTRHRRGRRRPLNILSELVGVAIVLAALLTWGDQLGINTYETVFITGAMAGAAIDRGMRAAIARAGRALTRWGRA